MAQPLGTTQTIGIGTLIMKYITTINGNEYVIELLANGDLKVNDQIYDADLQQLGEGGLVSLLIDNRSYEAAVQSPERDHWQILLEGELYDVQVQDERAYRLAKARGELEADTGVVATRAPMPGVVVRVPVGVDDRVHIGQTMVILESMKMENELKATRAGVVLAVKVSAGDSVEKDAVLVLVGDKDEDF